MQIPDHLKHLRTDRVGRPVPYINVWGEHDVMERWTPRFDRAIGRVGLFYKDDLDGAPDFTHQSPQRQRQCAYQGLCQVCGREVPWPDRKLALGGMSVEWIAYSGGRVPVVTEPWLCPDCAEFATRHCPDLIRRERGSQLDLVSVPSEEVCRLVISVGYLDGPYEMATRAHPAAMWVKVELLDLTLSSQAVTWAKQRAR